MNMSQHRTAWGKWPMHICFISSCDYAGQGGEWKQPGGLVHHRWPLSLLI